MLSLTSITSLQLAVLTSFFVAKSSIQRYQAIVLNASPEYYSASAGRYNAIVQSYLIHLHLPSIIMPLQVYTMQSCNCTQCFSRVLYCLCRSIQCNHAIVLNAFPEYYIASAGLYNATKPLYWFMSHKYFYTSSGQCHPYIVNTITIRLSIG